MNLTVSYLLYFFTNISTDEFPHNILFLLIYHCFLLFIVIIRLLLLYSIQSQTSLREAENVFGNTLKDCIFFVFAILL